MELGVHTTIAMVTISDGRYVHKTGGHLNINKQHHVTRASSIITVST